MLQLATNCSSSAILPFSGYSVSAIRLPWDGFGRIKDMGRIQVVKKTTLNRCARYKYLLPVEAHAGGPTQTAGSSPTVTFPGRQSTRDEANHSVSKQRI